MKLSKQPVPLVLVTPRFGQVRSLPSWSPRLFNPRGVVMNGIYL